VVEERFGIPFVLWDGTEMTGILFCADGSYPALAVLKTTRLKFSPPRSDGSSDPVDRRLWSKQDTHGVQLMVDPEDLCINGFFIFPKERAYGPYRATDFPEWFNVSLQRRLQLGSYDYEKDVRQAFALIFPSVLPQLKVGKPRVDVVRKTILEKAAKRYAEASEEERVKLREVEKERNAARAYNDPFMMAHLEGFSAVDNSEVRARFNEKMEALERMRMQLIATGTELPSRRPREMEPQPLQAIHESFKILNDVWDGKPRAGNLPSTVSARLWNCERDKRGTMTKGVL
jgi:hypothetical protein